MGDRIQLQQVVVNLLLNAAEAVREIPPVQIGSRAELVRSAGRLGIALRRLAEPHQGRVDAFHSAR